MSESWRTPTVISLCEAMRQTGEYDALPILADALHDADYPEQAVMDQMRGKIDEITAQRLVALVYSDETAAAVKTIEAFGVYLGPRAFCEEGDSYGNEKPVTYERLIRVGDRMADAPTDTHWYYGGTVEHGSSDLQSFNEESFDEYWKAYELITSKKASGNPFRCTC